MKLVEEICISRTAQEMCTSEMLSFASFSRTNISCTKHNTALLLGLERYWYWVNGYWATFTDTG